MHDSRTSAQAQAELQRAPLEYSRHVEAVSARRYDAQQGLRAAREYLALRAAIDVVQTGLLTTAPLHAPCLSAALLLMRSLEIGPSMLWSADVIILPLFLLPLVPSVTSVLHVWAITRDSQLCREIHRAFAVLPPGPLSTDRVARAELLRDVEGTRLSRPEQSPFVGMQLGRLHISLRSCILFALLAWLAFGISALPAGVAAFDLEVGLSLLESTGHAKM